MRLFTTLYILLLVYIVAALLFWGISLERQSIVIYEQQRTSLQEHVDPERDPLAYQEGMDYLEKKKKSRTTQYLAEGITFLLVILTGAAVVYTSLRRNLRLSRQQQNFMLSVTHELKSPIAAMKLNLQTLEKYELDPEKRNQLLERCILEANRLNDLCNNMLVASQMEGHQYVAASERLNLSALTAQVIAAYNQRYPGRVSGDLMTDIEFTGDELLLQMAVSNLLENAVKYTEGPVQVRLSRKGDTISLQVADQGPGIPDPEKKRIFSKFYRIGNENTRRKKGTGLGLYLTHTIVRLHKGQILVKDNKPQGAVFEITLPA
jgi:signal transduction histidine kinase